MSDLSPFDSEELQPAENAELPADDLNDEANRADVAQSSRRESQAQRSAPSEKPVEDDEVQRADEGAALPVQEVENEHAASLAAQPVQDDNAPRADEVASLPVQEVEDETTPTLAARPVEDDSDVQRADDVASLPVQEIEDDDTARLAAQPVEDDDAAQRADEGADLPVQEVEDKETTRLAAQQLEDDEAQRSDDARGAVRTDEAYALSESARERFPDLAEEVAEVTRLHDRDSPSDLRGYTPEENAGMVEELDRVERSELHHAVMVYVLRGIESDAVQRDPASINGQGKEGFRQLVDDRFPQQLIEMDRMAHDDLHRALNEQLDDLLEHDRANQKNAAQNIVQRGGAREMMQRLQELSADQLVDVLENAYRRVFSERPGLVSDENQKLTFEAIEDVRETLRYFGPGRRRSEE